MRGTSSTPLLLHIDGGSCLKRRGTKIMDIASGISAYVSTISRQLCFVQRCRMRIAIRESQTTCIRSPTSSLFSVSLSVSVRIRIHRASLPFHPDSCPHPHPHIQPHLIPSNPEPKPKSNASPQAATTRPPLLDQK